MTYTLFVDKILSISRSLAAMQVLADDCGADTGNHPLAPLLDDFRKPLVKKLLLQSFVYIAMKLRRYFDDVVMPATDTDFDRIQMDFLTPSGFGLVEHDLLFSALEQAVAIGVVVTTLAAEGRNADMAQSFIALRDHYVDQALKLLTPPYPKAITADF